MESIASVRPKCMCWGWFRYVCVYVICQKFVVLLSDCDYMNVEKTSTGTIYVSTFVIMSIQDG